MFADTTLLAQEKEDTLLAPLTAVTSVDNQPTVYVVNGDGIAEARAVTTGLSDKSRVELLSGVRAGEKVVVNGQVNLADGVKVDVVPGL